MGSTVKPLYSEHSRDPKKCSLYGGVHPRGVRSEVRYVHADICLNYNVQDVIDSANRNAKLTNQISLTFDFGLFDKS